MFVSLLIVCLSFSASAFSSTSTNDEYYDSTTSSTGLFGSSDSSTVSTITGEGTSKVTVSDSDSQKTEKSVTDKVTNTTQKEGTTEAYYYDDVEEPKQLEPSFQNDESPKAVTSKCYRLQLKFCL